MKTLAHTERLVGAYVANGQTTYTESAEAWFGMGLISKHGRAWADAAKARNTRTYQQVLSAVLRTLSGTRRHGAWPESHPLTLVR